MSAEEAWNHGAGCSHVRMQMGTGGARHIIYICSPGAFWLWRVSRVLILSLSLAHLSLGLGLFEHDGSFIGSGHRALACGSFLSFSSPRRGSLDTASFLLFLLRRRLP